MYVFHGSYIFPKCGYKLKHVLQKIPKRGLETALALFIDKNTKNTKQIQPHTGMLGVITTEKERMATMEPICTYSKAAEFLSELFDLLNDEFFGGVLAKPVISIDSSIETYASFCLRPDAWQSTEHGDQYSLNISSEYLNRGLTELCCSLLHEMVHEYNWCYIDPTIGKDVVKDVSRGNTYHNRKFKAEAEKRGLVIDRDPLYGWTITSPGQRLLDWLQTVQLADIQLHRTIPQYAVTGSNGGSASGGSTGGSTKGSERKSRYKEYICPCCKIKVRSNAAQELHLRCEDCEELFELVAP